MLWLINTNKRLLSQQDKGVYHIYKTREKKGIGHSLTPALALTATWILFTLDTVESGYTVKKGKVVLTQFGYLSFYLIGVPLPAIDSTQIKNLIWLSRTLVNVMGEYFANEIVQSCGKGYETEITEMGYSVFLDLMCVHR